MRQDSTSRRDSAPAPERRGVHRRGRRVRRADDFDRRRRAAGARADAADRRGTGQAQEVRLPVHQRAAAQEEDPSLQTVDLLRVDDSHRRHARAPRPIGLPRRRLRQGGRGDQGCQGARLPRLHQHDVLRSGRSRFDSRSARLSQRRSQSRHDADLAGLRLRKGARPGALPGRQTHARDIQSSVCRRQAQEVASEPQPALSRFSRGQGRLRVHAVGHTVLHRLRLAASVLPHEQRGLRASTYKELLDETDWSKYGRGKHESCENCMAHCGYEPTAVMQTTASFKESIRAAIGS